MRCISDQCCVTLTRALVRGTGASGALSDAQKADVACSGSCLEHGCSNRRTGAAELYGVACNWKLADCMAGAIVEGMLVLSFGPDIPNRNYI